MPRRKQARRMTVQDIRTILRLTHEQGLSVREVGLRLKLGKTTVATYLHRAREAGLNGWPLPSGRDDDATLKQVLFQRVGRPPRDPSEPDWPKMAAEMKRKGVTLVLLWEEYRAAHPDGYGYTWFCKQYRAFENRISPRYRNRHEAGAVMQTDYAGHTTPVIDPGTGAEHRAQILVAVPGASSYTFAWASLSPKLPDWIEAQVRALKFFGGVPKASPIGLEPMAPQWTTLRQSQGRRGQAALVRTVPDQDLLRHGHALRHDRAAHAAGQSARQGQGRRGGADRRALDTGPPA